MKPFFETRTYDTENAKTAVVFSTFLAFQNKCRREDRQTKLEQDGDGLEQEQTQTQTSNTN